MDSLSSLRQTAATRFNEVELKHHRNLKSTAAEQAADMRDAFEGLQLGQVDDPQAQALASSMAPLKAWAGSDSDRVQQVYATGLRVAGQLLGGPLGAGLKTTDSCTLAAVSHLAANAGNASRDFLEAVVPDSWTNAATSPQWELGQQLNLIREGRGDVAGQIGWVRGHMKGHDVHASDIEQTLSQRRDFTTRFEAAGWSDCLGYGPWELEGREVAMLYPTPGKMEEFRGVVESSARGRSGFTLRGHDGVTFNSNNVSAMVVKERLSF